jgi:hypothetical protein
LDKVNAAIATQTPDIQDAWEYAPTIARQSPTVKLLAAALALSETQVDALFVSAGSLAAL